MADITIGVRQGDTSGVDLLRDMGDAVGKSSVKWGELANAAKAAGKAVYDFARDSLKAYAESERVQKQLTRAAGEYSDALADQAEAMSKLYAVDDDVIKQSQTLLAQWGGAGAAAEDVTRAVLDYAAAMGVDATTATQDLIRNVESGGVGLAKLGVHFTATGNKGKDLARAVDALGKKFGGAAESDAESLIGRTHAATLAFEDMQKSLGGMLATALDKSGALEWLTKRIREVTRGFEILFALGQRLPGMAGGVLRGDIKPDLALAELKSTAIGAWFGGQKGESPGALPDVTGSTNRGMKDAAGDQRSTTLSLGAALQGLGEITGQYTDKLNELQAAEVGTTNGFKGYLDLTRQTHQAIKDATPSWNAWYAAWEKSNAKAMEKSRDKMAEWRAQMAEDNARAEQAEMKQWGQMGDAIGAAFVNGLASQIEKLSSGGEIDVAVMVGDILASVIGIAATAIGTAYGAPQLGAAIGNLAAVGIRAGAGAISRGNLAKNRARTYHEGGWVGPDGEYGHLPRYHSGAWIGADEQRAILQTGERVLSRREVGAMGGPAGVDAAARGGGRGVTIFMQAIDSKNASESLQTDLGKGMRTALRTGRGDLPLLFAGTKGPR